MSKLIKNVYTFINPSGFLEQHYVGVQTGPSVKGGVKAVDRGVNKLKAQNKPALVLIDISQVTSTDLASHMSAVVGMKKVAFDKVAIYGPLSLQILLNTLAIVADKSETVHAFSNRVEALEWLRKDS